jgi:hypothetical protein
MLNFEKISTKIHFNKLLLGIIFLFIFYIPYCFSINLSDFFTIKGINFYPSTSAETGQRGDTFGGSTSAFFNGIILFLIYLAYLKQKEGNLDQKKDLLSNRLERNIIYLENSINEIENITRSIKYPKKSEDKDKDKDKEEDENYENPLEIFIDEFSKNHTKFTKKIENFELLNISIYNELFYIINRVINLIKLIDNSEIKLTINKNEVSNYAEILNEETRLQDNLYNRIGLFYISKLENTIEKLLKLENQKDFSDLFSNLKNKYTFKTIKDAYNDIKKHPRFKDMFEEVNGLK